MIGLKHLATTGLALLLAGCSDSPPDLQPASLPSTNAATGNGVPSGAALAAESLPRTEGKSTAAEIFLEAKKSADTGNYAGAAGLLEEVVKIEPRHREALYLLALVNQDRAADLEGAKRSNAYIRSAWALRQIRSAYKQLEESEKQVLPIVLYHEATTYALDGKAEPALKTLIEAVDAGYANPEQLRKDPDLESIRKLPRFHDVIDHAEVILTKLADERARAILGETRSFPFQFKLPGLDGKPVSSADYRGKVMIVDFWGTWCPPCRKEIPHFVALSRKYREKGLEIVGLNYERATDEKEVVSTIASFVKDNGVNYPCLLGDDATKAQVRDFRGFPTTLYLDRQGKVRGRVVGFNPDDAVEARSIEVLITTLLAEPPPAGSRGAP